MTIQKQDFGFPALNSQSINLTLKDGDVPVNLTGLGVIFKASPGPSVEATVQKTENGGITFPNRAGGQIAIAIGPADFQDAGVYFWTVDVTAGVAPAQSQTRYYEGRIVFSPSAIPAT